MTTKTPRINVTLDPEKLGMLSRMAHRRQKPLSRMVRELIDEALELSEDFELSTLSEARVKSSKGKKRLSHADVWK